MEKLHVLPHEWVVVCDGRKALILENFGDEKFPNLRCREEHDHPDAPTHEQGTAPPGKVRASVGTARSATEETDWHEQSEHRFLGWLADHLDAAADRGDAKAMIIVAPPSALGVLRQAYSPRLRAVLKGEIDKDFVRTPIYEIEKHLFG
jgi:protein required for attachment to host cells